jgi:hypothetical protein
MKAALTAASAKLVVEIDAAGTRIFLADARTGQLIGGPEDLSKLGGIRSFVTRERKEALQVEAARDVTQLAFKVSTYLEDVQEGFKQPPLESSYAAGVRPLVATLGRMDQNRKKLEANTDSSNYGVLVRDFLTKMFVKVKNCYFHVIAIQTSGGATKGKLKELLFDAGVPEWVHSRITVANLLLDRTQELFRVLFPSDPSKGLSLTLKEWRDAGFRGKIGTFILGNSQGLLGLVNNNGLIRALTKLDSSIGLADETNPAIAKLLGVKLTVIPPARETRFVTEPGSKSRAGWKFPSPNMDTPSGAISALATAMLRVYAANLQTVDLEGDYYKVIANGGVSKAAVTPTNNFYVQWQAMGNNEPWLHHIQGGVTGDERQNVYRWLRTELRLSEKASGGKSLATALKLTEEGKLLANSKQTIQVEKPNPEDPEQMITVEEVVESYPALGVVSGNVRATSVSPAKGRADFLRDLDATEIPFWMNFQKVVFPTRGGKKKKAGTQFQTLTRLSPEGQDLVEAVSGLSRSVADRMKAWLRGFSDTRLQVAAVKLANAQFDELFIAEADEEEASDHNESEDEDDE